MTEQRPTPAPREGPRRLEAEGRIIDRPAVTHVAMLAVDYAYANPNLRSLSDEHKRDWVNASTDNLRVAKAAVNELSWESRTEAYKNDTRSLDVQIDTWNNNFLDNIKAFATDQNTAPNVLEERKQSLAMMGLALTDGEDRDISYAKVDAFRKKYVSEKKAESDIDVFIKDIANTCKNADGRMDLNKLENKLHALEPMLGIFGTHKKAGALIADFAMAEAMIEQEEEVKKTIADKLQTKIQRAPSQDESIRLNALWQKLGGETATQPAPEPQPPAPRRQEQPIDPEETPSTSLPKDEQLKQIAATAPELLEGRLPSDLEQLLPDGYKRYALGFNQSDACTSIAKANQYIQDKGGIDLGLYRLHGRFLITDPALEKDEPHAKDYVLGYRGPHFGRFVVAIPIDEKINPSSYPTAIIEENMAYSSPTMPDYPYPQDLFIHKTINGRQDTIVSEKYIAGFIDNQGKFHKNPNFMKDDS